MARRFLGRGACIAVPSWDQLVQAVAASAAGERPALTNRLMEAIGAPQNIAAAVPAVVRNKGAAGVDGMTVRDLPDGLAARWPEIERTLPEGRDPPPPVRRVMIPKR
jgi:RNA-directed DNA polymerase